MNHTAHISGAEQSLLSMVRALPDWVEPVVASPEGPLAEAVGDRASTTLACPVPTGA